ncbi:MAG: glycoside hydrolase family 88 protein [Candidatus Ornithospirochaeta sp.]|nr:glycoside hydrolase family 88 protein [Candidatus Ornithospirochaeta sp.]
MSGLSTELLDQMIRTAHIQTRKGIEDMGSLFKGSNSENSFYVPSPNNEWTNGMWTGEINILYELTGDESLKAKALEHVDDFHERIRTLRDIKNHDMGFLYSPSCVAAWMLYGSRKGREAAIMAADYLISRFQEKGQFIQAWGPLGRKESYKLIIDCLMNIPLLFWASNETGDGKYRDVALRHFGTSIKCVLRPDDSTYHTYYFDPETGEPLHGATHQGNRNDSAWARGQAWGIYGSALAYRYTASDQALDVFERTTRYFLDHLPESVIPYWDFDFTDGDDEPRDSSALAIAIDGMMEMARLRGDASLRAEALELLVPLYEKCAAKSPEESNGQLLHGVYCKHTPTNTAKNRGIDECNTWGDYFYAEALMRAKDPDWKAYW